MTTLLLSAEHSSAQHSPPREEQSQQTQTRILSVSEPHSISIFQAGSRRPYTRLQNGLFPYLIGSQSCGSMYAGFPPSSSKQSYMSSRGSTGCTMSSAVDHTLLMSAITAAKLTTIRQQPALDNTLLPFFMPSIIHTPPEHEPTLPATCIPKLPLAPGFQQVGFHALPPHRFVGLPNRMHIL